MLSVIEQNGGKIVAMTTTLLSFSDVSQTQHEKTVRLARLAMLIECEGSITIGMSPPSKTRNRPSLTPTVDITNTAQEIIDEAKDSLVKSSIGFSVKGERHSGGLGKKLRYDVNIHGFDRVEAVLLAILPYMRSKKRQAELALEFITSRRNCEPKAPYSERDWQVTTEIRKLNGSQPRRKALAKAKAYLDSPESLNRPRAAGYFRKYVEMCTELQAAL